MKRTRKGNKQKIDNKLKNEKIYINELKKMNSDLEKSNNSLKLGNKAYLDLIKLVCEQLKIKV
jgi:hypothetical protein